MPYRTPDVTPTVTTVISISPPVRTTGRGTYIKSSGGHTTVTGTTTASSFSSALMPRFHYDATTGSLSLDLRPSISTRFVGCYAHTDARTFTSRLPHYKDFHAGSATEYGGSHSPSVTGLATTTAGIITSVPYAILYIAARSHRTTSTDT